MTWNTQRSRLRSTYALLLVAPFLITSNTASAEAGDSAQVRLHVPENRPGCQGTEFFLREFHRALGPRQTEITQAPTITVWIEEVDPDAFKLELEIRQPKADPFRIIPRRYGPHTECSKVVAYAADIAATLVLPPPPRPSPQPPNQRKPLKMEYVGVGSALSYGLSLQPLMYQPFALVGVKLSRSTAIEQTISVAIPYSWHGSKGTDVDVKFSMQAAIAACYRGEFVGFCPRLMVGGFFAQTSALESPKKDSGSVYVTAGADLFAEKRIGDAVALRATVHVAGTILRPAVDTGNFPLWEGSRVSAEFRGTLIYEF